MAIDTSHERKAEAATPAPTFSRGGETALILFGLWMIVGLFLDGWAHSERKPDSFFTPWHAVIYTGFAGAAGSALLQLRAQHRPGASWRSAVPAGYGVSLIGLAVFALGAGGDLVWHEVFGVEVDLAALLSPSHLLLMAGGLLALTGPFRTAWREASDAPSLSSFLPALGSLTLATGLAVFFTFYLSPFARTVVPRLAPAETDIHDFSAASTAGFVQLREMWAVSGILLTTVLVMVPVLLVVARWRPPAGSLLAFFGAVAIFEGTASEFARWPLMLAVICAGLVAELLVRRGASIRVLSGVLPAALWLGYFVIVAVAYDLAWSAELWTGSVVLAVLTGLGLGLLVAPPARARRLGSDAIG